MAIPWDAWTWVIFIVVGLLMVLLELIVGVDTGLDLAIMGLVLIVGGAVTAYFSSWYLTVSVTSVVGVLYLLLGRRYVRTRLYSGGGIKTNADALIGRIGIIEKDADRNTVGLVRMGTEQWRASCEEPARVGEEVEVVSIKGITLTVKKRQG